MHSKRNMFLREQNLYRRMRLAMLRQSKMSRNNMRLMMEKSPDLSLVLNNLSLLKSNNPPIRKSNLNRRKRLSRQVARRSLLRGSHQMTWRRLARLSR
jgi:hypothetical protein